ncbi:MAG: C1 family peptidase [Candidatus Competibacteraceae bacterium]|nr:C1 family peptidase [Candidatus Competibacteraceae bacterium]
MILTETRRDRFYPLTEIATIPEAALQRLAGIGITTVNELRDFWVFGDKSSLVSYLGESPLRWFAQAAPLQKRNERGSERSAVLLPSDPLQAPPNLRPIRHPRGLLGAHKTTQITPQPQTATPPRDPEHVTNLASFFPAPRDQGERGTCVAFATTALMEYHSYRNTNIQRHSEQFLYWACKQLDGIPNMEGTYIESAGKALAQRGACLNTTWRYEPTKISGNESHHPPPSGAETEAAQYTRQGHQAIAPNDIAGLCAKLDQAQPIVLGVQTFPSWDYPNVQDTGEIPLPLPGVQHAGGHAVCLVGYERRAGIPGNGSFIFRNSWSGLWASGSRYGAGYGTLFFDYVRLYGMEALF